MCVFVYMYVCICYMYVCVYVFAFFYVWVRGCVFFECVSESKYKQKRIAGQSVDDNIEISNREVAGFVSLGDI